MAEPLVCRVLPHRIADGPTQMALDHALLDAADAEPTTAILRTYEWRKPTLSLGYFQAFAEVEGDPRWRGVPVIRRMSGGGALLHDRELTYALIVPRSHELAGRPSALYKAVHSAIASRMRAIGIAAGRRGEFPPVDGVRPFLCFLDRDPEDVLVEGTKIVGSAQRRRPLAVLQHGSILLGRSVWTPELPGLAEIGPCQQDVNDWRHEVSLAIAGSMHFQLRDGDLTPSEESHASSLAADVYGQDIWTRRR